MRITLRRAVDRSIFLTSMNYFKGQVIFRLGLDAHRSGGTHSRRFDLDRSVAYIEQVVADYLAYSGAGGGDPAGKDILEVGPGDNLGVALLLLAKGARSIVCIDGFHPPIDERNNAAIYRQLLDRLTDSERNKVLDVVQWGEGGAVRFDPKRLTCLYGVPIHRAESRLSGRRFDLIVSCAVLEHVPDLDEAWVAMVRLLRPDGQMWHKIDFRNHKKYDQFHPLHFLTMSDRAWNLVTSPVPTLNRERLPAYRRLSGDCFKSVRCYTTRVLQEPEFRPHREGLIYGRDYGDAELAQLAAIRSQLAPRFRDLTDEELLVSGIFLICQSVRARS